MIPSPLSFFALFSTSILSRLPSFAVLAHQFEVLCGSLRCFRPLRCLIRPSSLFCSRVVGFFLVLEPGELSLQAKVSRFLQLSFQRSWSCASILFNPLSRISFSSTSFHLFLCLPFFEPSICLFENAGTLLILCSHPFSPYVLANATFALAGILSFHPRQLFRKLSH